jgi:DNA polymerase-1
MTPAGTKSMLDERPLLILMDGHALVHRAWHAIQTPLNVSGTGEEVRAVYGFLNSFLRTLLDWRPTHCAITFDLPYPTFRHLEYKKYKAQRPPTPPELRSQFGRVRELMTAFGIPIYEMRGFEADDVLGTLSRQAEEQEMQTLILTGDTDTLQLVSPWVRVLMSSSVQKRSVYDEAAVMERYGGLRPEVLPDIKALQGDASDNIPGLPSIGGKTAIRLLNEFGSIEGIYESLDSVPQARLREVLRENHDVAVQGKRLTTIVRTVPVELDLEASRFWTYDRAEVVDLLKELEFFSAVSRIPEPHREGADREEEAAHEVSKDRLDTEYVTVDTPQALDALVEELISAGNFAFDVETTSKDPMQADLVGLSFSTAPGRAWYVPVGHAEGRQLPMQTVLEKIAPLLESDEIGKSAHNANFDVTVLAKHGTHVRNVDFDTILAAHLTGKKAIALKALALDYFGHEMTPIADLIGTGRKQVTMAQVPIEKASDYASADADFTLRLRGALSEELHTKDARGVFESLEMPLMPVLVRMQLNGVTLDQELLSEMSSELAERVSAIETGMYELVGHEFNLNSSQQLGDILFNELRLPPTKRTKKGYSTDASALDGLKEHLNREDTDDVDPRAIDVLDQVLEYRQLTKIKSTYVDALPVLVNPETGRIHTRYNQTGSATGRVSSNDPNVQNIPVRTELGRRVRRAFVAENAPDRVLLAADYSQIELRVLAHISKDAGLLDAFHKDEDIHTSTAASVYGVAMGDVTADMRRVAKIMNFGVLYGLSAYGISRQTDLGAAEGAAFIETYFGKYPGIRSYVDSTKASVAETGYVETLMGRRRYIPEISSSNRMVRASGERMAVNMPIQGTAADIIKIAMVSIQGRMDDLGLDSMMILQVHDELIFEVPQDELARMEAIVTELMPSAMSLAVPLNVELKTGYTWGDME